MEAMRAAAELEVRAGSGEVVIVVGDECMLEFEEVERNLMSSTMTL